MQLKFVLKKLLTCIFSTKRVKVKAGDRTGTLNLEGGLYSGTATGGTATGSH